MLAEHPKTRRAIRGPWNTRKGSTLAFLVALGLAWQVPVTEARETGTLPTGFQESTAFSGLTQPSAIRFASDGRVFVAEKSGLIKVFDSLTDATPDVFADLRTNVYNFWDRGLLGLALHPNFPSTPYVYALYAYDFDPNVPTDFPRWGTPGATSDPCPSPPGPTSDGCVVTGRLSRLQASGNQMVGSEQVLIQDWCQQYPSHSVGDLGFGADGALYVSGGDGSSFTFADYGQDGNPLNPCGDPPGGVGATLTPPTAEGGSLRSQDLRTPADPTSLDGAVLRLDPITGQALPTNPLAGSGDPNARRIVAHGLRNPFRFAVRPGTSEIWIGDVGWNTREEINRLQAPTSGVRNFGWPCYEGAGRQSGYDSANLNICENLYAEAGAVTAPHFSYAHNATILPGEPCGTGSSSTSGLAFYEGGDYPAAYDGSLFFADYSRDCIWVMFQGSNGLPDPANIATFVAPAANPVDVEIGPGGDLFYVDFDGGTIKRIEFFRDNQPPTAVAAAAPTSGSAPLTVNFDGTGSSDPDPGDSLTFAWDLDGDGQFDDSNSPQPTRTYAAGNYTVRLRVADEFGATDESDPILISAGNTGPTAVIDSPSATLTWKVGDPIAFSGHADDPQDGPLPAAAMNWDLVLHHCPTTCHTHPMQSFPGVASGSFSAPDHDYPSWLELRLTATDSDGLQDVESVRLDPKTVDLTFATDPSGLQLTVGASSGTAPFSRTVIVGSSNSISAPTPQTAGGVSYQFSSWSDGGAQTHNITAPQAPTTYTATFNQVPSGCAPGQFEAHYFSNTTLSGTPTFTRCESAINNDWGTGGPGNGVPTNNFSARWIGTHSFNAGEYTFTATSDDGIRVWVDGALIIDAWKGQPPTTYTAVRTLTAGDHQVKVEYYEGGGGAVAKVSWATTQPPPPPGCATGQFDAHYFSNTSLSGTPTFTRCESAINNDWGTGGPGNGVPTNNFSVRWTGMHTFAAGDYTFAATSDDGIRVWLDGTVIIDGWKDQSATTYTAVRTLTAGDHQIKVEYYEKSDKAVAKVSWGGSEPPPPPPPPPPPGCSIGQFDAHYFSNTTLSGTPTFTRCESTINNDWGTGGPGNGVPNDNFSVRWTGMHSFTANEYSFTATSDDGIRVWVDGVLIIDAWKGQAPTTYTATRTLTAGDHQVKVEYYEGAGGALVRVGWAVAQPPPPPSCPSGQFDAHYFSNSSLSGTPTFIRCEAGINNDWGTGGPGNGVPTNSFSARWIGTHSFGAGTYTFTATADDGIRVWVDGVLIIDAWKNQPATTYTASRTLAAGDHQVKVEYYEASGGAVAKVSWAPV